MTRLPLLLSLAATALAKTVSVEWDIGWVTAAPDGYSRPVIAVNGQWPPPVLEANVNDTIVATVTNSLGNETTSVHWHGLWQRGTPEMDGGAGVTQCAIPPGETFRYEFVAYPAGTFWYHSHDMGQYPDGLRAPLIVHDPENDAQPDPQDQVVLTVSDWYRNQMPGLIHSYLTTPNFDGRMPNPNSSLVNDQQSTTISIRPGERKYVRLINMSALATYYLQFDSHNITVVAIDSVDVEPQSWEALEIVPGQRYDFFIDGLDDPDRNYAFVNQMAVLGLQNVNQLVYDPAFGDPEPFTLSTQGLGSDFELVPTDEEPLLGPVDHTITMEVNNLNIDGVGYRITQGPDPYISPRTPSLYTALTTGFNATDPAIYGQTNAFVVAAGDVVQLVVNSNDLVTTNNSGRGHPMHLHGHVFQVVGQLADHWDGDDSSFPAVPMKRDTTVLFAGGSLVVRFRAGNPGVWMFHCHIEWHLDAGMASTIVEAPLDLQREGVVVPQNHLDSCRAMNLTTSGNCAGNTADLSDTAACHVYDTDPWGALITGPGTPGNGTNGTVTCYGAAC
ncbi:putative multicopper oxidase type 1 [Diplodia seriata]|uniref:Putative multicopper oxidase type 1 n=1 Tax=Diplodia seriata TaxID=420778 RepID=A0A0G2HI22_9PEZI|nr:putative multicopper oxidase type 1 [Diplodia seriata]